MKKGKNAAYIACNGGCRANADCAFSCVGCGVCVSVCKFEAISINAYGVAEVDEEKCIGCGLCKRECPRSVIKLHQRGNCIVVRCANENPGKETRAMCEVGCIGCGICQKVCPSGAAQVQNNLSQIDDALCLSCGQCLVACPRGTIGDVRGIYRK